MDQNQALLRLLQIERAAREAAEAERDAEKAAREAAEAELDAEKAAREAAEAELDAEKAAREATEAELDAEKVARKAAEAKILATRYEIFMKERIALQKCKRPCRFTEYTHIPLQEY